MQADIRDLIYDLKVIRANLSQFTLDVERGIIVNQAGEREGEPKAHTIERLFFYLKDAVHDMGRIGDNLKDLQAKLDDLLERTDSEELS